MNPQQVKRNLAWADALESGAFEQAQGTLRLHDQYCCLGVACELYRRQTGIGEWVAAGRNFSFKVADEPAFDSVPPPAVAEFFGWDQRDVHIRKDPQSETLPASSWNDVRELDFKKLGALIRAWLESGVEK